MLAELTQQALTAARIAGERLPRDFLALLRRDSLLSPQQRVEAAANALRAFIAESMGTDARPAIEQLGRDVMSWLGDRSSP